MEGKQEVTMAKNPFDVAIEQLLREETTVLPSGSSQDQAVLAYPGMNGVGIDGSNGNPEKPEGFIQASNEVIVSTSNGGPGSFLYSVADVHSKDQKLTTEPILNDTKEYSSTVQMLLNYDTGRYNAIPIGPIVQNSILTGTINPVTFIGYNYLIPAHIISPLLNQNQLQTLKCDEQMPSSTESTQDNSIESSCNNNLNLHGGYACTVCPNKFFTRDYLQYHIMKAHSLNTVPAATPSTVPLETTQERLFHCPSCPKTYTYLRNLRKHESSVHSVASVAVSTAEATEDSPAGGDYCRVCRQKFPDQGALMIHMKAHTSTCQVCYKIFGSKRGLKLHSVIHYGNIGKQFGCDVCGKRYSHSRSLKQHMKRHEESVLSIIVPPPSESKMDGEVKSRSIEDQGKPETPEDLDDPKADFQAFGFGTVEIC